MTPSYSSRDVVGLRATRLAGLALGLSLGLAGFMGAAQADKVGVAAAVNPDAFSSLSGTPNKQLSIGKNIFFSERINTTNSGLVQVLLLDGSTFTVGPNSDLVIDKFVYDPKKKTGEMIATFSKGTMRFIGGKLSKNEGGVTVKTPSGALAIRGGMFQGSTSRGIYSFLYGDSLTFRGRNGHSQTIFQPGYTFDVSGHSANIRPTTPQDTNVFMQALSSQSTQFGTAGGTTTNPGGPGAFQDANNLEQGADQAISDANTIIVQTAIAQQLANFQNFKSQTNNPTGPQTTPSQGGGVTEPEVEVPVEYTGYASGFLQSGRNGKGEPDLLLSGIDGVKLALAPKSGTITADLKVTRTEYFLIFPKTVTDYNIGFRGGAFNQDKTYFALADSGSTSVIRTDVFSHNPPTIFSSVAHTTPEPGPGFGNLNAGLCSSCDFLQYGFWASDLAYGPNGNQIDKMGGWWVATDKPVSPSDMPTTGTARYDGDAVGTLALRDRREWQQFPATGKMTMDWNFGYRAGWLQIDKFGGEGTPKKSFGGPMVAPGQVDFAGIIGGNGALGSARGSFVGPRGGEAPAGVMGNFGIGNSSWKANGVFGGSLVEPR